MQTENDNNNNQQSNSRDLLSELKKATAIKQPSTKKSATWNFDDDDVEQDLPPVKDGQQSTSETEKPKETPAKKTELSEKEIKAGAETGAAAVELLTSLLSEGIINFRYYRKFTPEEREKLNNEILDKPDHQRTDDEQTMANKFERLMSQRDKKLGKVKMSETARERLIFGFTKHAEITGKPVMSPQYILGITIGESVIKSVFEALMD